MEDKISNITIWLEFLLATTSAIGAIVTFIKAKGIKENRYIFVDEQENKSDLIYSKVNVLVNEMIDYKSNQEELSKLAMDVDNSLDNFLANLKELNNNKKYR